ncbi:hypothetical protein MSAN_01702700 [Mycena sanguinolenta]|uniref:Uncharacterized protein n=1 Tax=Mycena sanguinolenta TaxID=230812 RepID=A0A8H6Y054_9AGAR|nr:hypothetical protein MSAN_01702700 [Mycena sanguinolenta]
MYSVRIGCRRTPMIVALYQGDEGEKEWKKSVSIYSRLRHPYILQIYATANLIPFQKFLESFQHSAILQAYICAYTCEDQCETVRYCEPMVDWHVTIPWVRASTGRLCIEFGTPAGKVRTLLTGRMEKLAPPDNIQALHDPNQEAWVIGSLAFERWYSPCHQFLAQYRSSDISMHGEVKLGTIIHCPAGRQFQDAVEIAYALPGLDRGLRLGDVFWYRHPPTFGDERLVTSREESEDGSVRYNSGDVFGRTISLVHSRDYVEAWFSQANYIFTQLKISSNYSDYVFVYWVHFSLHIRIPNQNPPDSYLFLCSPADFQTGPMSFQWPTHPAYWSLDPSGSKPLSHEEAANLGFLSMELKTEVRVVFWDDAVYSAQRKFHVAKGFDPDGQDVARELGHPLYELSVSVANVQEEDSAPDGDDESEHPSSRADFVQHDPLELTQEFSGYDDASARHCTFRQLVELVKFSLIFVLGVMHLYEHVRP